MRIVDVGGTPHEIGECHGHALAGEIAAHLDRWREHLAGLGVERPDDAIRTFVDSTGFVAATREHAPDLADEVDGIAHGAALAAHDAWFLQLMDEAWMHPSLGRAGALGGEGCTTFGVVDGIRSWSAQTMDLEGFRDGAQAVLRVRPAHGHDQLVLTMAGCVGLLGVSAAGFSVMVNALPQAPAQPSGVPVAIVTRLALAAANAAGATAIVRDAPHATGQHYLVTGTDSISSHECSPAAVVAVMPDSKRLWHTNHPLVGYLTNDADAESDARWEAVRPVMGLPGWGRRRTRELLEAPPVCRPLNGAAAYTFAAAVVEQRASASAELWVTHGPPDADAWELVTWPPRGDGQSSTLKSSR